MVVGAVVEKVGGRVCVVIEDIGHLMYCGQFKGTDCPSVATHCLSEAVVALVTRTQKLKAILLEDGGDKGARVCNKE